MFVISSEDKDLLDLFKQIHISARKRDMNDPRYAKEFEQRRAEREQAYKDGTLDPITKIFLEYTDEGKEATSEEIAKAHEETRRRNERKANPQV
jgi:hypothetical protein